MLYIIYIYIFETEREEGGERERETELLFHLLIIHLLVDSCVCPDQGLNPQPWHVGMML